jgi:hypothetical protein
VASFVIEYYTNKQFPEEEVVVKTLPEYQTGELNTFSFIRQGIIVGNFSYILEKNVSVYSVSASTEVEYEGKTTQIESSYLFGATLNPLDYFVHIDSGGEITDIECEFTESQVLTTVDFKNQTVNLETDLPENVLLVENNMPGYWELILQTLELVPDIRYKLRVFVPQAADVFTITLTVDDNPVNLNIEGVDYECQRIREVDRQYTFLLYEGHLLEFKDDGQEISFHKNLVDN